MSKKLATPKPEFNKAVKARAKSLAKAVFDLKPRVPKAPNPTVRK